MLYTPPSLFDLPSASVMGIAAETALRLCFVDFKKTPVWTVPHRELQPHTTNTRLEELRVRGPVTSPVFVVDGKGKEWGVVDGQKDMSLACYGPSEIVALLERNNTALKHDAATNVQLGLASSVEAVVRTLIAPVTEFMLLSDPVAFATVAPSLRQECSLFDYVTLRPDAYSTQRVEALKAQLDIQNPAQAAALLEKGFLALERLLQAAGAEQLSAGEDMKLGVTKMFVGTTQPTTADCYAFGAASFLFHGRFDGKTHLAHARAKLLSQLPLLQAYSEGVRQQYFDAYAGSLQVRPIPNLDAPADADIYSTGRTATLVGTAMFASFYFLVVNAETIVALLGILVSDDEEEGEHEFQEPTLTDMGVGEQGEQQQE